MRPSAIVVRATLVAFTLAAGLAGAASAAHVQDPDGAAVASTLTTDKTTELANETGKDRDKAKRGPTVERSGQTLNGDETNADAEDEAADTNDTATTEDTEDTADTQDTVDTEDSVDEESEDEDD